MRIWGIGTAVLAGLALLGINHRAPAPKFHRGQTRPRFIPPRMHFLKRGVFWCFVCPTFLSLSAWPILTAMIQSTTTILQALSYFPVSLYIATFTASLGSPLSATIVLSVFNSSTVVGRIIIGYLTDRYPYPWIMFGSLLGSGVAAFLLWGFADTLVRVFVFVVIFASLVCPFNIYWKCPVH